MSEIKWSEEQLQAINTTGTNIIVSAGAGSGKTAVLKERIITHLENGKNISDFIILTFTKLAAFEIKERIVKAIKDASSDAKYNEEQRKLFKNQLQLLDQAAITTFDAYCLELIKKYHYLLNLDKTIDIAPSIMMNLKKQEILNAIFEEYYQANDSDWEYLVKTFTNKNDNQLAEYILKIYDNISNAYTSLDDIDNIINENYSQVAIDKSFDDFETLILNDIDAFQENVQNFVEEYFDVTCVQKYKDHFKPLFLLNHYGEINEFIIESKSTPRLTTKDVDEDLKLQFEILKSQLKENYDNIKKYFIYKTEEEARQSILVEAKVIGKIIKDFNFRLTNFKESNALFEFADLNKYAIKLLSENENIKEEIKNSTVEIMVDEFQDTNDAQEAFINLVANDNLYLVGDIKQSIYRFRYAEPRIFTEYYNKYKNNNGGIAIDLNKNFRSRKEVLTPINQMFNKIMTEEIGGANYLEEHQLQFGLETYDNLMDSNYNYLPEYFRYEKADINVGQGPNVLEAEIAATIIIKHISEGKKIVADGSTLRAPKFSDFTVLMRARTHFETFKKVFEAKGIPLAMHAPETFVDSDIIYTLKNIFILIDAFNNDEVAKSMGKYSLTSVARSFIFNFSDEKIHNLITENNKNKENIFKTLEKSKPFEDLFNKFQYLATFAKNHGVYELIIETIDVLDIHKQVLTLHDVVGTERRINTFLSTAQKLSTLGYSLNDLIAYFEQASIVDIEEDIRPKIDMSDNKVNFMTIHASKGLEFNFCIYPQLNSSFTKDAKLDEFSYDKKYGLITPCFQEGKQKSIRKILAEQQLKIDEISEKLRLLYVALTRAKQKMFIIGEHGEFFYADNDVAMSSYILKNLNSFNDCFLHANQYFDYNADLKITKDVLPKPVIKKMKTLEYLKFDNQSTLASSKSFSKKTLKMNSPELVKNMQKGTKLHELIENIDFDQSLELQFEYLKPNRNEISIIENVKKSIFNKFEYINYYTEYELFEVNKDGVTKGFIDLLIETEEELIIIDYKTRNIDDSNYHKQLHGYRDFLKKQTDKKMKMFLYSLANDQLQEIN